MKVLNARTLAFSQEKTESRNLSFSVILSSDCLMVEADSEIIKAVRDGDVDRYAELIDRYQGLALRVAFSMLGNTEDAKDASQDAFISAYCSLSHFRGGAKFSTWFFRIVVNECKDIWKRRARQPQAAVRVGQPTSKALEADEESLFVELADPAGTPGDQLANRELAQQISRAIGKLPLKSKTAFVLHHIHGLPLGEVADIMECRLGTVKAHIFRATQKLKRELTPQLEKQEAQTWT